MFSKGTLGRQFRLVVTILCILSLLVSSVPHSAATANAQASEETERSRSNHSTQVKVLGPSNVRVNTWNGNLFYPVPLLMIPGRSLSIELSMSYNSRWHDFATSYGYGWQFSYNMFYVRDDNGDIIIIRGDGRSDRFINIGRHSMSLTPPLFQSPTDVHGTLREYRPGKYVLRSKYGIEYYFDSPIHNRVTKIQEPNGNSLVFTYDADMLLSTITDASGRQVNLTYTDGKLTTITDPNTTPSRSIQFQYDTNDNLISIVDARHPH